MHAEMSFWKWTTEKKNMLGNSSSSEEYFSGSLLPVVCSGGSGFDVYVVNSLDMHKHHEFWSSSLAHIYDFGDAS